MAYDIEIEITEQIIEVELAGATSWPAIADKPEEFPPEDHNHVVDEIIDFPATMPPSSHTQSATTITADAIQIANFANPLALDATSHKDFKCSSVTGNTTINLTNASDGDSGVIELIMDGTGGYSVSLGAMFTKKLGTGTINTAAGKDNFIFWFMSGSDIIYTIQTV